MSAKNLIILCLKIVGAFLCFSLVLVVCGYMPIFAKGSLIKLALITLLSSLFASLFLYWIFKKYFKKKSFSQRFMSMFKVSLISLCVIYLSSYFYDNLLGQERFMYRYGNYAPKFSIIFKNKIGQKLLKASYNLIPFVSTHYTLLIAEEALRVFTIKNELENPSSCAGKNQYNCFEDLYQELSKRSPLMVSGNIMMVANGALSTFKLKKKARNKKERFIDPVFQLSQTTLLAQESMLSGGRMRYIFPTFPLSQIRGIEKKVLERLRTGGYKEADFKEAGLSPRVAEYMLLENMENDIIHKFFEQSSKKISNLLTKLKENEICKEKCIQKADDYLFALEDNKRRLKLLDNIEYVEIDKKRSGKLLENLTSGT